jgi:hypothetical protein
MLYLATKVIALGICRPPLGKVRRYFIIRKNSDLCAVRCRDGWESRTCEKNVRNTSGPLNLTTHGSQSAELNSRASQHLRWPISISLAQAVEIWVRFIFIKVWGKLNSDFCRLHRKFNSVSKEGGHKIN